MVERRDCGQCINSEYLDRASEAYKRDIELLVEYIIAQVLLPPGTAIIYITGAVNYHVLSSRENNTRSSSSQLSSQDPCPDTAWVRRLGRSREEKDIRK